MAERAQGVVPRRLERAIRVTQQHAGIGCIPRDGIDHDKIENAVVIQVPGSYDRAMHADGISLSGVEVIRACAREHRDRSFTWRLATRRVDNCNVLLAVAIEVSGYNPRGIAGMGYRCPLKVAAPDILEKRQACIACVERRSEERRAGKE